MPYTPKQLQEFVKQHLNTIGQVTDLFTENGISSDEGEKICTYIAGFSAGVRGKLRVTVELPQILAMSLATWAQCSKSRTDTGENLPNSRICPCDEQGPGVPIQQALFCHPPA